MVIGYTISGNASNDGVFFENVPEGTLCPKCQTCINPDYYPEEIKIHRSKKYDVSYTWDLRTLFSQRFSDFCKSEFDLDITEKKISCYTGDLYYYVPPSILEYDAIERKTKFLKKCDVCGNFEEVIGATPVFLKSKEKIKDGFHRSDLEFSGRSSKHPLLFVSVGYYEILRKQKFRGLYFEEILDDPWEAVLAKKKKQ